MSVYTLLAVSPDEDAIGFFHCAVGMTCNCMERRGPMVRYTCFEEDLEDVKAQAKAFDITLHGMVLSEERDWELLHRGEAPSIVPRTDESLAWLREHDAKMTRGRRCRECGCTDNFACDDGCEWVEDDLCSRCV